MMNNESSHSARMVPATSEKQVVKREASDTFEIWHQPQLSSRDNDQQQAISVLMNKSSAAATMG